MNVIINKNKNIYKSPIIGKLLFSKEEINSSIEKIGAEIAEDYKGKELVIISVLKGAVIFLSDLIRNIDLKVSVDFMGISTYGFNKPDTGVVKITKDLDENIEGKHVLIVEDIIDTGLTISYLMKNLYLREPAGIEICTLIDRSVRRIANIDIKYSAFTIGEKFLVGYGLDYKQKYRNLDSIYELNFEAVKKDIESIKSVIGK